MHFNHHKTFSINTTLISRGAAILVLVAVAPDFILKSIMLPGNLCDLLINAYNLMFDASSNYQVYLWTIVEREALGFLVFVMALCAVSSLIAIIQAPWKSFFRDTGIP